MDRYLVYGDEDHLHHHQSDHLIVLIVYHSWGFLNINYITYFGLGYFLCWGFVRDWKIWG